MGLIDKKELIEMFLKVNVGAGVVQIAHNSQGGGMKLYDLLAIALWHVARLINKIRNAYYTGKFEYNYKMSKKN